MAADLPSAPGTPTRYNSTETSVTILWTPPTDNGGTPISDYIVMWDAGTGGQFVSLGKSLYSNIYTPPYTLITGNLYTFKVMAVNYIGTGPASGTVSVIAANMPGQPSAPTAYSATETQITIQWGEVYSGGSVITQYAVFMAMVGSSSGRSLQTVQLMDVTVTGTLDITLRRFTTGGTLITGGQYVFAC